MSKSFFNKLFGKFRFSAKKVAAPTMNSPENGPQGNAQDFDINVARELSQYEQSMTQDIVGSADIFRMNDFRELGISANDKFDNGENAITFATKRLEESRGKMEQAANDFHQKHWEVSALLDGLLHIEDHEMLRAAAFLHSDEILQRLAVPDDMKPKFTLSQDKLNKMVNDNGLQQADYDHTHATFFFQEILDPKDPNYILPELSNVDANEYGEQAIEIFKTYTQNFDKTASVVALARDHKMGGQSISDMMKEQPMTSYDLFKWSKNNDLSAAFPFLKDVHFSDEMRAQMEARYQQEHADKIAHENAQVAATKELSELADQGLHAIANGDVVLAQNVFESLDADSVFPVNDELSSSFVFEAVSVFAEKEHMELMQNEMFKGENAELVTVMESINDLSSGKFHAEFTGSANAYSMEQAAGDMRMMLHESVLDFLDVPQEERPAIMIAADDAQELNELRQASQNALGVLGVTVGINDDVSLDAVHAKLSETMHENPYHAAGIDAIEKHASVANSFDNSSVIDDIINTHNRVVDDLENRPDAVLEKIRNFAADADMVSSFPFLQKFAPAEHVFAVAADAEAGTDIVANAEKDFVVESIAPDDVKNDASAQNSLFIDDMEGFGNTTFSDYSAAFSYKQNATSISQKSMSGFTMHVTDPDIESVTYYYTRKPGQ